MNNTPAITIAQDLDEGTWAIYATSYSRTEPAGPRLFRAPPHPDIEFNHATEDAAEADANKLRSYLDRVTHGPKKAKGLEEATEKKQPEPVDLNTAWWK